MKVLVAVDESETAEKAFQFYLDHIHRPNHELVVVHAGEQPRLPPVHLTATGLLEFPHEEILNMMKETAERMEALREKYDVRCDSAHMKHKSFFQTTEHHAGERIVTVAAQEHCDVIVIGSSGMGSVRRTILGSVSSYVVHHTKIPVLVYPKN